MSATVWPAPAWWQTFGDPQLTTLIEQAQANNRDLVIAAARVTQAEARSALQRSALFPQIGAQGGYVGGGCAGLGCQQFPNRQSLDLTFNASYELDFWGLARDNLRAADEQLKSARFAQQAAALTVVANVGTQYLNVLAIRRRITIARENIAAINDILDVIKLRVKTGATSHLDLAREQAQIETVQAQLPSLETQEKQAIYTLAVLLGRPPEEFDVAPADLEKVLPPAITPGLPSELLLRRPDIAQAEADLASAHANVDAARAAFLPQISLTGSGGFVSSALGTLLHSSNFGYDYGANLLQAIFDGGKLAGQKDLAESTEKEFVAAYQSAALNGYADVELALTQVAEFQPIGSPPARPNRRRPRRPSQYPSYNTDKVHAGSFSQFSKRNRPCSRLRISWPKLSRQTGWRQFISMRRLAAVGLSQRVTEPNFPNEPLNWEIEHKKSHRTNRKPLCVVLASFGRRHYSFCFSRFRYSARRRACLAR